MMQIMFEKYQGAGNDFIIIDNRNGAIDHTKTHWLRDICDRRFGIGADGVMLLEKSSEADFSMVYFNADGLPGSMCGNGGRCMVAYAAAHGLSKLHYRFLASDGMHNAYMEHGNIYLQMQDVQQVEKRGDAFVLDTGSPHYVAYVDDLISFPVEEKGREIRNSPPFLAPGINVNFIEWHDGTLMIRTYERGVEAETLSCGTGVTAAALAHATHTAMPAGKHELSLQAPGGTLQVRFHRNPDNSFNDIWLIGPGTFVYSGAIAYPG